MKNKIDHPKVFISYAWGSQNYQTKVLSFAAKLEGDGIDVVIDKWNLTEGNDTYAFMELCVKDTSITNVLMLLDPLYAQKANDRAGGVGTETQIISVQIYNQVKQDKFIPIVFERDSDGNVCKPIYLQSTLHFDLTRPDDYEDEYKRLVKKLYGIEIYQKPELGSKPDWVDAPVAVSSSVFSFQAFKSQSTTIKEDALLQLFLEAITKDCIAFASNTTRAKDPKSDYIQLYDSSASIREKYLELVKTTAYIENSCKRIASFFEDTANAIDLIGTMGKEIIVIRLHELFLYTIANYLKTKKFDAAGYLLGKTYFDRKQPDQSINATGFRLFYSGDYQWNLDQAINARDNKEYCCGTAKHWMDSIAIDYCTKEQFVLADLICNEYRFYSNGKNANSWWFPITYVYDDRFNSALREFSRRLISKEYVQEVLPLFGFSSVEKFVERVKEIENNPGSHPESRYPLIFYAAPSIGSFIKAKDIGTYP